MAENKNKIIVYRDWINTFDSLTDEEAGKLIKHFFRYINDKNPEAPDRITKLLFEPIKQTLKRDLKKYEATCLKNKQNGTLGGRPKTETQNNPKNPVGYLETQNNPNKPDSDSDSDSDSDKDNGKKVKRSLSGKPIDFIDTIISEFVKIHGSYEVVNRGKERKAAGKILQIYKKKYPGADSEEILRGLSHYFEQCIDIEDPWLHDNMSLSIMVSKFNEIKNYLKNGKTKRNSSKAPDGSTVTDVIAALGEELNIPAGRRD